MSQRTGRSARAAGFLCVAFLPANGAGAAAVAVRQTEGVVQGCLTLRAAGGEAIADGELIQTARGDTVTSRLVFRFRDGSLQDETAVFRQRRTFRFVSDHLVQRGPTFPRPMDVTVRPDLATVRSWDENGKEKVDTRRRLPADLANGLILTLLKNLPPGAGETKLSMVLASPKPLLADLVVSPEGQEILRVGGTTRAATRYLVRVELRGLPGVIAPILGKSPPPTRVWILGGKAPAFLKSEGPLYAGGPIWTIELALPVWPTVAAPER